MTTYALRNINAGDQTLPVINDIFVSNGNLATVSAIDQITQDVSTRLQTFLGEYFADVTYGLDFSPVFNKPLDTSLFDTLVKKIIAGTLGVASITNYQSVIDTRARNYSITFSATAINGDLFTGNETFTG